MSQGDLLIVKTQEGKPKMSARTMTATVRQSGLEDHNANTALQVRTS
jgi:hypothetical protein